MKNALFLAFVLLICFTITSQSVHIITHNKTTIITNPKEGTNSFKKWGIFPSEKKEIRRITMHVTLAHPKDIAIAHWDYMDRIKILKKGGDKGEILDYEIGRMLTPYGSNFKEDWNYTWNVDVTDFEPFLRDSVQIEYMHSGYEAVSVGWDLTIDFKVDFGPPVAKFISVNKMWNGGFQYGNPENDIEKSLAPIEIVKAKGSSFGRFRIQHTGHGMDRPSGCSEFCSRWREFSLDGKVVDKRNMWKDCGDNPLYPQGGTWIFDRAYWCPGDLQTPDIIDVPLTNLKNIFDLDMEPFTANDLKQPVEQITSYLFQFASPKLNNDVRVEEIMAPNNVANYNRLNPRGFNPQIIIRNLGGKPLKTVDITYYTIGFEERKFTWKGELKFYEAAILTLPGEIYGTKGINTFKVIASLPNGVQDQWKGDNMLETNFFDIPTLPTKIVVDFLTNNTPEENALFILNSHKDTVFMKSPKSLMAATHYSDTLDLAEGNYFLMLTDSVGNGLEFWFQPKSGFGTLQLKDEFGNLIHLFESDCGNGQFYSFRTNEEAVVDTSISHLSVTIFPRMVKDSLTIYTTINKTAVLKIRITKDGEFIEQHEFKDIKESASQLDMAHLENGRYVMEVYINGEHKMNRRFNKL